MFICVSVSAHAHPEKPGGVRFLRLESPNIGARIQTSGLMIEQQALLTDMPSLQLLLQLTLPCCYLHLYPL